MRISTGHSVDGPDFFGRERELENLARIFEHKKASVIIPGLRRIGKTSIVKEFMRKNSDKHKFIYLDLEGRSSFIDLCKDLTKEIKKKHPKFVRSKLNLGFGWNKFSEMIQEIGVAGVFNLKTGQIHPNVNKLIEEMENLLEALNENGFIFAFDEFSDFLWKLKEQEVREMKHFLSWLRRLRQEEKIRLIISGSINIISTAEELNVTDQINDLTDIEIFPLTNNEINTLLTKLTKDLNIQLDHESLEFAVERLSDGIPFFVQLFASALSDYKHSGKTEYDLESLKEIYFKITGKQHKEFIDLHARLKDFLPANELKVCHKILAHLSSDPMVFEDLWPYVQNMGIDKERFNKLLKRLSDECYITRDNGVYRFVSPMIADWWQGAYEWER